MGSGFVHLKPFNQVLPRVFLKDYQSIKDFQPKDGDVWVSSFPKCGTTWTQELVWCLMNDLDFVKAKDTRLDERVKFFELSSITELEEELKFFGNTIEQVQNDKSDPRIIKTHLSCQSQVSFKCQDRLCDKESQGCLCLLLQSLESS